MKRTTILSMAGLVLLAACQKEISPVQQEKTGMTLSATVEQQTGDTKTALGSGNTVVWSEEDEVRVWNSDTNTNTPFTLTEGAGTTQGRFSGDEIANPQYAFYPSSAVTGVSGKTATFTLPAVQHYVENSFDNGANVAVAQISGNNMAFKNICGVLKLQLKGTVKVTRITITGKNGEKLNGEYQVKADNDPISVPCLTTEDTDEQKVVLDCGNGIQLNNTSATNFYIVIPQGALSKGFNVLVTDKYNGSENVVAVSNTISRSTIKSMPAKKIALQGQILPGYFSTSATTKVRFASGNVKAYIDAAGNPTSWSFAENQYDEHGNKNANNSIGVSEGYVDLFCWSTDGVGASSEYSPWGIHTSTSNDSFNGSFVDWATNTTLQELLGTVWHTPSYEEWNYILNTRAASTINGTENARWAHVRVNGITGILLFPDSCTWTSDMGNAPDEINTPTGNALPWNVVNYTVEQFNKIEAAGIVFLVANTFRLGSKVTDNNQVGYYWSSTRLNSSNIRGIVSQAARVPMSYPGGTTGAHVRFVTQ